MYTVPITQSNSNGGFIVDEEEYSSKDYSFFLITTDTSLLMVNFKAILD